MSNMTTIYRNGQAIAITVEEFNRRVEAREKAAEAAPIVARYASRGGKYELTVKRYELDGEINYTWRDTTSGRASGGGGGAMTDAAFAEELARKLYSYKRFGTNLKPIVRHEAAEAILAQHGVTL